MYSFGVKSVVMVGTFHIWRNGLQRRKDVQQDVGMNVNVDVGQTTLDVNGTGMNLLVDDGAGNASGFQVTSPQRVAGRRT